jgi:hypothetical protein
MVVRIRFIDLKNHSTDVPDAEASHDPAERREPGRIMYISMQSPCRLRRKGVIVEAD